MYEQQLEQLAAERDDLVAQVEEATRLEAAREAEREQLAAQAAAEKARLVPLVRWKLAAGDSIEWDDPPTPYLPVRYT